MNRVDLRHQFEGDCLRRFVEGIWPSPALPPPAPLPPPESPRFVRMELESIEDAIDELGRHCAENARRLFGSDCFRDLMPSLRRSIERDLERTPKSFAERVAEGLPEKQAMALLKIETRRYLHAMKLGTWLVLLALSHQRRQRGHVRRRAGRIPWGQP